MIQISPVFLGERAFIYFFLFFTAYPVTFKRMVGTAHMPTFKKLCSGYLKAKVRDKQVLWRENDRVTIWSVITA